MKSGGIRFLEHMASYCVMMVSIWGLIELVAMPKIELMFKEQEEKTMMIVDAQGVKGAYVQYAHWCNVYINMEKKVALDDRQLHEKKNNCAKSALFLAKMKADWEAGLVSIDDVDIE